MVSQTFQTLLDVIYPARCAVCGDRVEDEFGLCGSCWKDAPFITGQVCETCGVELPNSGGTETRQCEECEATPRPWQNGRAALRYEGLGRKLVLSLKYSERHDVVEPAALWMAAKAENFVKPDTLVAPVPLHWTRHLKRRFNQSDLLARIIARKLGLKYRADLLQRSIRTAQMKEKSPEERRRIVDGSMRVHPRRRHQIAGRSVLIVDDVMTTGSTLSVAARACLEAGAAEVSVLVLARAAEDAYISRKPFDEEEDREHETG